MTDAPSPPTWLQATGLPHAWRGQAVWRVLDTDFGAGERLAWLWQAWSQDPHACRLLHLVAFAAHPPPCTLVQRAIGKLPGAAALAQQLAPLWFGLLPGMHRLVLHGGRVQLTLCIGPTPELLRAQQFSADTVVIGPESGASATEQGHGLLWDSWDLKALARLCRRGSTLAVLAGSGLDTALLPAAGWASHDAQPSASGSPPAPWAGLYQPAWPIKGTRRRWTQTPTPASSCVVVGAGLAGAGVAGALALRGWQVTVLDAAAEPAAGASALPVGLFTPQTARDDGPRARLSRAGIRATLQAARLLLHQGQDWNACGVAHLGATTADLPPAWPEQGQAWACAWGPDAAGRGGTAQLARPEQALWHAAAGWIKPRQLVRAWLAQPGVRFVGSSPVQAIRFGDGRWQLFGPDGRILAEAPQLVLAAAGGSQSLLRQALAAAAQAPSAALLPLTPVDGQVSWALHQPGDAELFPRFSVNGAGSALAHVPWPGGTAWFVGATYEAPAPVSASSAAAAHALNRARLGRLLPAAAASVSTAFAAATVQAWRGTRWTMPDRLPLAGRWPLAGPQAAGAGLCLSTAMGSRGLTYAALCGELIAAQLGAEPLPLEAALQRCIDVQRVASARSGNPASAQII